MAPRRDLAVVPAWVRNTAARIARGDLSNVAAYTASVKHQAGAVVRARLEFEVFLEDEDFNERAPSAPTAPASAAPLSNEPRQAPARDLSSIGEGRHD